MLNNQKKYILQSCVISHSVKSLLINLNKKKIKKSLLINFKCVICLILYLICSHYCILTV